MLNEIKCKLKEIYYYPFWKPISNPVLFCIYKLLIWFLSSIERIVFFREFRRTLDFIERTKLDIKDSEVLVLANGPSVKDLDLKKLNRNNKLFKITLNSFTASVPSTEFKSDLIVFCDPASLKDEKFKHTFESAYELNVPIIMPINMKKYLPEFRDNIYFISALNDVCSSNVDKLIRPLGYYSMTAFYALSISKNISTNNILICGYDNSYFKSFNVDSYSRASVHHHHFYAEEDTEVGVLELRKGKSSSFHFYDFYQHFRFLEKICDDDRIVNVAKETYLANVPRDLSREIYNK